MRLCIPILLFAGLASGETLILKRAWVEQFKDRATIDAAILIDHAHKRANPASADGDMHVSGRAPKEVGLPMVAEMMNAGAAPQKKAFDLIHANEGKNVSAPMNGAWRLWFEHPGSLQKQFDPVPVASNTNPDHSFEIHPVLKYSGGFDVSGSVDFVKGFPGKTAEKSFASYERMQVTIKATATAVTMDAKKSGFNYAVYRMKLLGTPKKLVDGGLAVLADVFDSSDEETALVSKVRMIFLPGTGPLKMVSGGGDGSVYDAMGIPRVNLNAISAFLKASGNAQSTRKLPYEMIVVALKEVE